MTYKLFYGQEEFEFSFSPENQLAEIEKEGRVIGLTCPRCLPPIAITEIEKTLKKAMAESRLPQSLKSLTPEDKISLIIDDHTRSNSHTRLLLPPFLAELSAAGIAKDQIQLIIATGTHRPPSPEELRKIFTPRIYQDYQSNIIIHSCREGLLWLGEVEGIPVLLNEKAFNSRLLFTFSDLDFHYFAGVAGGPKQIIPGISGEETIRLEHLKMFGELGFAPGVSLGNIDGNPVYETKTKLMRFIEQKIIEKGGFALGLLCVLDPEEKLLYLTIGDIVDEHIKSIPVLNQAYTAEFTAPADIVIMSARQEGIDLYQAGKSFHAASRGVKPGGKILLLAPCPDGFANDEFKRLMAISNQLFKPYVEQEKSVPPEVLNQALRETQKEVMKNFKIGQQKAVDFISILSKTGWGNLYIISESLAKEKDELLMFKILNPAGRKVKEVLEGQIKKWEAESSPTYLLVEDSGWFLVAGR